MAWLLILFLVVLAMPLPAAAAQRPQISCTAPQGGTAPTDYLVEREANGTVGSLTTLPASGPLTFTDTTTVAGVNYRYRCTARNAAGPGTPSAWSQAVIIVDVPGQAGVSVIIITEGQAGSMSVVPQGKTMPHGTQQKK